MKVAPLMRCCADDEGFWPFGVALRGKASNHLKLRWLKTVVVSVRDSRGCNRVGSIKVMALAWIT